MQLGNDIVDLKIDSTIRPRFIERILHPEEVLRYPTIQNDPVLVWTLWAAKESAFKAYRQNNMRYFIPNLWAVDLQNNRVQFGTQSWILKVECTGDAVAATCSSSEMDFISVVRTSETELSPRDQSALSRDVLKELTQRYAPRAVLSKDEGGVPRLTMDDEIIPFSMSHHGRHVFVSLALPNQSPLH
ncbi:MAG: 4-phosphopantetheinyl transferase family protein [Chitinophagaceae bacterium]|nr:4-phosphopantetheinyl transferase family protein [Oligoflexus sp.]